MKTADPKRNGTTGPLRLIGRNFAVVLALFALAGTALAASGGAGAGKFAAEFEARAVGDPSIEACRDFGLEGQKIEARYEGTFTVPAEFMPAEFVPAELAPAEFRLPLRLSLEILVDRSTGVGTAEGTWQLGDPATEGDPSSELVARGELLAVVTAAESSALELDGMLVGTAQSAEGTGVLSVLLNFTASLSDGATFPHLKGTVGDPTVGDPTGLASNPAVLVPAVKC
jgi:hypothetical protein